MAALRKYGAARQNERNSNDWPSLTQSHTHGKESGITSRLLKAPRGT
jgi:hypothetical protein